MPFGIASAPAIFLKDITVLAGLKGTVCYADDILVASSTLEEHSRSWLKVEPQNVFVFTIFSFIPWSCDFARRSSTTTSRNVLKLFFFSTKCERVTLLFGHGYVLF
eukprot:Pompholyxophrys_punicea_v1_NODE_1272_length_826_cov_4.189364.p1 type:complete len:106 gc:universal NODE_1272_length_826_cov_4.189364:406-723(+)